MEASLKAFLVLLPVGRGRIPEKWCLFCEKYQILTQVHIFTGWNVSVNCLFVFLCYK